MQRERGRERERPERERAGSSSSSISKDIDREKEAENPRGRETKNPRGREAERDASNLEEHVAISAARAISATYQSDEPSWYCRRLPSSRRAAAELPPSHHCHHQRSNEGRSLIEGRTYSSRLIKKGSALVRAYGGNIDANGIIAWKH